MRQVTALALMTALCCIFSGCMAAETGTDDNILLSLSQTGSITAEADITYTGENAAMDFRLRYEGTADTGTVTVIAPQELSGVVIQMENGETSLESDTRLYTGHISSFAPSPVSALPLALQRWQSGCATESTRVSGGLCLTQRMDDKTTLLTVFDSETHLPLSFEVVYNDRVVMSAVIREITFHPASGVENEQQISGDPYEPSTNEDLG